MYRHGTTARSACQFPFICTSSSVSALDLSFSSKGNKTADTNVPGCVSTFHIPQALSRRWFIICFDNFSTHNGNTNKTPATSTAAGEMNPIGALNSHALTEKSKRMPPNKKLKFRRVMYSILCCFWLSAWWNRNEMNRDSFCNSPIFC